MKSPEARSACLSEQPFDVAWHPSRSLVAAGVITGAVETFSFSDHAVGAVSSHPVHTESCRAVRFQQAGEVLVSAGADCLLAFRSVERAKQLAVVANAHDAAINRLEVVSDTCLASGDDEGHVRLWDTRSRSRTASFRVHEDFVADLHFCERGNALLTASGDGTLAHLDLRAGKVRARSDNQEDELLSVTLMKRGKKVVVGSQEGVLSIFDMANIVDISDRFPGHPQSVDALVSVSEDLVLTGSSDGVIRVISILPNKMLGIVGEHSDWPVERLALSPDGNMLASASHDNTVKLWDIAFLLDGSDDEEEEAGGEEEGAATAAAAAKESDEEEDSDAEKKPRKRRRAGGKEGAKGKPAPKANFFAGLL